MRLSDLLSNPPSKSYILDWKIDKGEEYGNDR